MAKFLDDTGKNVTGSMWSNWEGGLNEMSHEHVVLIKDKTGAPLSYIIEGKIDDLTVARSIRLRAREEGLDPDAEAAPGARGPDRTPQTKVES